MRNRRLSPVGACLLMTAGDLNFYHRLSLTAVLSRRLGRPVDVVVVREAQSEVVMKAMSKGIATALTSSAIS